MKFFYRFVFRLTALPAEQRQENGSRKQGDTIARVAG